MTKRISLLLVLGLLIAPQSWAQDITASESCAALSTGEQYSRLIYEKSKISWWVHTREWLKCSLNPMTWLKKSKRKKCWEHFKAAHKFSSTQRKPPSIRVEALNKYSEDLCTRAEQKCPVPSPSPANASCTEDQIKRKLDLEKQAQILEFEVICGSAVRSKINQLVSDIKCPNPKNIPRSSEIITDCDCELEPPPDPTTPTLPDPAMVASLTPEEQNMLNKKIDDINNKIKTGDTSYWDDLDSLGDQMGSFAGTNAGITTGDQPEPPTATEQALDAVDSLMAEMVTEKKEEPAGGGRESSEPDANFAGTDKPALKTVWDTQQKTDQREQWKKKATDKKNGISDNPLRGIFAQVSSRYTVKTQDLDQFLTTQKGKYSTLKPE